MTRIAIDPARPVGRLDRKVFGGFVEHLGRCIYGGLYEEGSPLSDDRGFRKDVLGLLRELRLGVLRWPGGNFVSNYHWADGIGPTRRAARAGLGGEESNRFGTDEYLAYCAELGTEPYICLNMGTGTLEEAPPRSGPSRRPAPATPARCPTWRQRNCKRLDRKTAKDATGGRPAATPVVHRHRGAMTEQGRASWLHRRVGDYRVTLLLMPAGQTRSRAGSAPGPPGGDTECMIRLGWKWTATQWVKIRKRSLT